MVTSRVDHQGIHVPSVVVDTTQAVIGYAEINKCLQKEDMMVRKSLSLFYVDLELVWTKHRFL